MPRCSDSMAALAAALAKAQAELINPEKSLTATIRAGRAGEGERSFRYAPLSSGLDIVRKTLGQHEIATLQTTAIDTAAGMVNLTTTLAHASGEWIASDWPVCPIAEAAQPQRMGAALTYARRYSLFTLVGIAGEDDLDAPDLNVGNADPSIVLLGGSVEPRGDAAHGSRHGEGRAPADRGRRPSPLSRQPVLAAEDSAKLRRAMLVEITGLGSATEASSWATSRLPSKNILANADARAVEIAFEAKLAELPNALINLKPELHAPPIAVVEAPAGETSFATTAKPVSKTASLQSADAINGPTRSTKMPVFKVARPRQAITKTVRHRNKEHLRFVQKQPCLVCGRQPSDPHHLRFAEPRALGRKVSDEFVVPLCRVHHREVHRATKEPTWWQTLGIAPLEVAHRLWQTSQSGSALQEPPELSKAPGVQLGPASVEAHGDDADHEKPLFG